MDNHQAGGDNLLNPETIMATSSQAPDSRFSSGDKHQNGTESRQDTSETADIIATSARPMEPSDHGDVDGGLCNEGSPKTAPIEENGKIPTVEALGTRELKGNETASEMLDSQEMDDVEASDQGLDEERRRHGRRGRDDREADEEGKSKDQTQTLAGGGLEESSEREDLPDDDPAVLKRHQRAGLYRQGLKQQETAGDGSEEALRCYLAAITGLTESEAFPELPQCLHQISNIYFEKKEYEKAVHFIQAEKMYYETALIDIANLQKQLESNSEENDNEDQTTEKGDAPILAGTESPEIIKAREYQNLAKLCLTESKPQLALEYCGKATKVYREVYGDSHPVTVGSLDLFTLIYADVGKKLYADAMQKFDAEEKVPETSSAEKQTKSSDTETAAGEETTHELRQRSEDDAMKSPAETDPQTRTEFEPAPQPEEQDDWVTTCLLMLLFLLIIFLVLLVMSYFYCLGNEHSSICHQFKGDLSYWYMRIRHYSLGFGNR